MLMCVLALWSHEVMVRLACSGQDLLLEPQLRVSLTQRHIRCHVEMLGMNALAWVLYDSCPAKVSLHGGHLRRFCLTRECSVCSSYHFCHLVP